LIMSPTQLFLPLPVAKMLGRVADKCGLTRTPLSPPGVAHDQPETWKHGILLRVIRSPRARRYLLRLQPDGAARLVLPRRGSRAEALRFLARNETWLLERFRQWQALQAKRQPWSHGTSFQFRGEQVILQIENKNDSAQLRFSDQITITSPRADYRPVVLAHLRRLAEKELPSRTRELARLHHITIQRVTIRNQKTRWGSCSARGTISLNWRLIQAPEFVRDYLIIHELMHRRQMNHSVRYWKLVAEAFPDYRRAEQWLKATRLEAMA
jgi:predicted metal-dependent hydrolase